MKRIISLLLVCVLCLSGCAQNNVAGTNVDSEADSVAEKVEEAVIEATKDVVAKEDASDDLSVADEVIDDPEADPTPYEYKPEFDSLDNEDLDRYIEDNLYNELVNALDSDKYFVENISTVYISQEYIDELEYNSQSNIYFGYTLKELEDVFQGQKFVFTLGDSGDTIAVPFEDYDDTYDQIIRNVAIGTGVILICVTVSVVTGGVGAPAVSMIFATAAKSGTIMALSSGTLGGVAKGVITAVQTGDVDEAIKQGALAGSEGFKWGAIAGTISGGASEAIALKGATLNGLTMNEAAEIQKESKYPLDIIKQLHSKEEYEVFKAANLKPQMINGKTALIRSDIDLNFKDALGRTNLERMRNGLSPLDPSGVPYELHHIGQKADATLTILTRTEHDSSVLHGFISDTEIDRAAFAVIRKQFWKTTATVLETGL